MDCTSASTGVTGEEAGTDTAEEASRSLLAECPSPAGASSAKGSLVGSNAVGSAESTVTWAFAPRILSRISEVKPLYTPMTTTRAATPMATPSTLISEMTEMMVCLRRDIR